ncbi:MAG TPA: VOC family protein [Gemmatimonadaceae bacterium]|nr:VOC family protein [Gemmatimonadaceae bacterium]
MGTETSTASNVKQAVPFFGVEDMKESLRFYLDGLGFEMKIKWEPDGVLRWCWLQLGDASLMLQEFWKDGRHAGRPEGKLGQGVSICFVCDDALAIYREIKSRGIDASRPFVGNGMWVTTVRDPDGYRIDFESYTDVPEETVLAE